MIIRCAAAADLTATRALMGSYRNAFFPGVLMKHDVRVMELDGCVLGFIGWRGDRVLALYVDQAMRGKGVIGPRLLAEAEGEIRAAGHSRIRIMIDADDLRAHRFYVKHDYETNWDRDEEDIAWMIKPLL